MKRLALFLFVMSHASAAVAFNPNAVATPSNRIGILNTAAEEDDLVLLRVAGMMRGPLARELRKAGFEVFDKRVTFDDLRDDHRGDAGYYIEFVSGEVDDSYYGGVGLGGRRGGIGLDIGSASIRARLRIYEAATLEVIDEVFAASSDPAVMPASIGIGTRGGGVWLGLPVRLMRVRSVARDAARDAAQSIVAVLEAEARHR